MLSDWGQMSIWQDSEGWGMGPEGMVVRAMEILIKGKGTVGKDRVFRVEPGSKARRCRDVL